MAMSFFSLLFLVSRDRGLRDKARLLSASVIRLPLSAYRCPLSAVRKHIDVCVGSGRI